MTKKDITINALRRVIAMADAYLQASPEVDTEGDSALRIVERFVELSGPVKVKPPKKQRGVIATRRPVILDVSPEEIVEEFGMAVTDHVASMAVQSAEGERRTCKTCHDTGMVHKTDRHGRSKPTGQMCMDCEINAVPEEPAVGAMIDTDLAPVIVSTPTGRHALVLRPGGRTLTPGMTLTDDECDDINVVVTAFRNDNNPSLERIGELAFSILTGRSPRPPQGRITQEGGQSLGEILHGALQQSLRTQGRTGGFDRGRGDINMRVWPNLFTRETGCALRWRGIPLHEGEPLPTDAIRAFRAALNGTGSGIRRSDHSTVRRLLERHYRLVLTDREQASVDERFDTARLSNTYARGGDDAPF